jgi:Asparagine synthase (glutamine-hydrolyzing)
MCATLSHRGPDDQGIEVLHHSAFGHQRLSILDLSDLGHQPMSSPDKAHTICYNGELYNFKALRQELLDKGYTFRSDTDTEVILHAWQEWGVQSVERFNGMFAFALYEAAEDAVYLVRDRMGIKPLYYAQAPSGEYLFASEVRTILASDLFPARLNKAALPAYLRYQSVPSPDTLIEGIQLLEPGHYLKFEKGKLVRKKQYWSAATSLEQPAAVVNSATEHKIRSLLTSAVEHRMISDVPIVAFLCGRHRTPPSL